MFDQGELYAVALAKAMGIVALVSDDTKDFGPHDTLVRELIEGVIPFAFYELLFLKFINSEITVEQFYKEFADVANLQDKPMQFYRRIAGTVRRFSNKFGTKRDREWIGKYCLEKGIDFNRKMMELRGYLMIL